jgi:tripartite-type tricarboxylate transporter receptor subunit TctC
MPMVHRRMIVAAGFTLAFAAAPALAAENDFYAGKTFNLIVGFSPGGGYDAYARVLAQFLPNHIPGHPNVVIQNMPAAGSLVAVRSLDATQPKDGTAMVTFNNGLINQAVVQPEQVSVDFTKLAWIGVATPDFRVCYGYGAKGPTSWDEMMNRDPFILGTTAKGAGDYINGAALRVIFGAHIKHILGFPGSAEVRLATERGELDGDCGSFSSIPQDWLDKGTAHMFVRFNKDRPEEIPESAVYINTFAKTQEQRDLLDFLDAANDVGRPYVMSSAVPADRIAIMRKAFDDTMKDPAFLAQAKKGQLPIHPVDAADAEKSVNEILQASPAIIAKAKEIYE